MGTVLADVVGAALVGLGALLARVQAAPMARPIPKSAAVLAGISTGCVGLMLIVAVNFGVSPLLTALLATVFATKLASVVSVRRARRALG